MPPSHHPSPLIYDTSPYLLQLLLSLSPTAISTRAAKFDFLTNRLRPGHLAPWCPVISCDFCYFCLLLPTPPLATPRHCYLQTLCIPLTYQRCPASAAPFYHAPSCSLPSPSLTTRLQDHLWLSTSRRFWLRDGKSGAFVTFCASLLSILPSDGCLGPCILVMCHLRAQFV